MLDTHFREFANQRGFIVPAPLIAFGLKYGLYVIAGLVAITLLTLAVKRYNEGLREQGRAEVRAKWDIEKRAQADKTAELVTAARAEERANQAAIQKGKDEADAKRDELQKRVAAFERDNGRLRVNRDALCKRQPDLSGTANSGSGNTQATGTTAERAGAGEIDLDDVAREIGRLGRDLDAANIQIVELIGVANACQRR